jgi:hypothetical protein
MSTFASEDELFESLEGRRSLHVVPHFLLDAVVVGAQLLEVLLLLEQRLLHVVSVFPAVHQFLHLAQGVHVVFEVVEDLDEFVVRRHRQLLPRLGVLARVRST